MESYIRISRKRVPHAAEYYDQLRYDADPIGRYRLKPNQKLPHVNVNSQGYRGREFSGKETVLLLGDSVTFGIGASSDKALFSRFLENGSSEKIADASVRAYRVFQHYAQLPRLIELLPKLKHIVIWGGYADLLYWATTGGDIDGAFQFEMKYMNQSTWEKKVHKIVGGLFSDVSKMGQQNKEKTKGTIEDLVHQMEIYLNRIIDIARARGLKITFLLQPFVRIRPSEPELKFVCDAYSHKTRIKCGLNWYQASEQFVKLWTGMMGDKEDIHFIDVQTFVSEDDFLDQVHLRETSFKRVTKNLLDGGLFRKGKSTEKTSVAV